MQQHEPLFVERQVSQRRYGFTDEKKEISYNYKLRIS